MNEIKKHALALSLIAILIIVKFILVPVIDWQDNTLTNIRLLEKKQIKIENVLNDQTRNLSKKRQLIDIVTDMEVAFFPYQSESAFKISQQKKLEALLSKYNLLSQNIGWQTSTVFDELSITRYPVQLRFQGELLDVITFFSVLESEQRKIKIADFNLSLKGQNEQELGTVNGRIVLYFYLKNTVQSNIPKSTSEIALNVQGNGVNNE
tara:strand:- start:20056 stop:20679 length:624 start_codon:yes stop_codon:yes gene_type:complete